MAISLVHELQRLAASGDTPPTEVLRMAKVVAAKLNIDDARSWIDHETNGYPDAALLPSYRIIPCELRGHNRVRGWQQVRWDVANQL
ncbi:MAG TPA: hypothetical protein VFQ54_07035, partial [Thermomicrobiales bacterium]|nr:hypothetical protein [Thermomicrobiales bacterium]